MCKDYDGNYGWCAASELPESDPCYYSEKPKPTDNWTGE